eukprot:6171864-Pleurochrysis_carterae.AAC.2
MLATQRTRIAAVKNLLERALQREVAYRRRAPIGSCRSSDKAQSSHPERFHREGRSSIDEFQGLNPRLYLSAYVTS